MTAGLHPLAPAPSAPPGTASRWMSVGRSQAEDARVAGRAAALQALQGDEVALVIVFASPSYDLEALQSGIREVTGDAPLVGCTTAGELTRDGPADDGVVVTVLGGAGFDVAVGVGRAEQDGLRHASKRAAACVDRVSGAHVSLLMLSDGLIGDQEEVVRGAYQVTGARIPLVGGCAGDGMSMTATHQLVDGEVLSGAVVAAAIASDAPIGVGVAHGWRAVGDPLLVTASHGTRVHTLNDRPALDVYLELLDAPAAVHHDPDAFIAYAATHPLGLPRRSGEEVRYIAGADFEERSLITIAAVPEGGLTWLMEGDRASVLVATADACEQALDALDGPPIGVLAFDCIARRQVLDDVGLRDEVGCIAAYAGQAPLAGFYTYGEVARTRGIDGFHNQTLVVLAVG